MEKTCRPVLHKIVSEESLIVGHYQRVGYIFTLSLESCYILFSTYDGNHNHHVLSKIFWTKNIHQRSCVFDDINFRNSGRFYRPTFHCTPTQPLVHTVCTALEMLQCHVEPLRRTTNIIFVISSEKVFLGNWLAPLSDS
jgi:hypothetical protein